jgi:subtilisin family serine protease
VFEQLMNQPHRHRTWTTAIAFLAAMAITSSPALADSPPTPGPGEAYSDQLLVGFKDGVSESQRERIISRASGSVRTGMKRMPIHGVRPRGGLRASTLKRRLLANDEVSFVEPDYKIAVSKVPNDPLLATQYGLGAGPVDGIDAPDAWDSKTKCAKVAVLDTGVDTDHPDLQKNIYDNSKEKPDNGKDDDDNGYVDDYYGFDAVLNRGSGEDRNGHGTHVAGIIGGVANNGFGISGVCWTGNIIPVRFMDATGSGSTSNAIQGIEYAVKRGAKVINASFGMTTKSEALHDAIDYAQENGVLIVAAAGNDGKDIDSSPVYPASFTDSNVLSVAASTADDQLAAFSNYGDSSVDVAAPGDSIVSTYIGGTYMAMSGTSMAAPFCAGMAGILRAKNSDASYAALRKAIRYKVDKPAAFKDKVVYDGRADLKRAIDYIVTVD